MTMAKQRKEEMFDAELARHHFPCLQQEVNGKPLAFLDSAASAQKPQVVIDCLSRIYSSEYANVHRGVYHLSELATRQFEAVRGKVAEFLKAEEREIVFTRGATEAINLVAHSYGGSILTKGDVVLISEMEHHANIVPWQIICEKTGATLKAIPVTDKGELQLDAMQQRLAEGNVKIVSLVHLSNALGTINPMEQIIKQAHEAGAKVLVDACQSVVHLPIDVKAMDADFLVFSGHKLYGPNGTGVLYGKYELLDQMPPYMSGGEMIDRVSLTQGTTFQKPPLRFEAGTPVIAEIIALGEAIDFTSSFDRASVLKHEQELLAMATGEVKKLGFKVIGEAENKGSVLSFNHETAHASDIGSVLDQVGVAVRAGHHCAQPLMERLGIPATARASFAMYNTQADVEALIAGLHKVNKLFG